MNPYAPAASPAPAPSGVHAPPRPAGAPSTGLDWAVVALVFCWPFALAAMPHTLRASRALGAGDRIAAAAEGARARRLGIWGLVVGLVLSVLTVAGVVVGAVVVVPRAIAGEDPAAWEVVVDPDPGSGPADGVPVRDLLEGACYDTRGLTEVVARVEVVDCVEPHGGEMYLEVGGSNAFRAFDDKDAKEPYPGDIALAEKVEARCAERLAALTDDPDAFDVWHVAPASWEWRSGITDAQCFAEPRDGITSGSIALRTSDN
jgi:hypothetical protein